MKRLLILAPAALLALAACDKSPTRQEPAPVASVHVAPDERTLAVGQTLQLLATIRDTRGGAPAEPVVDWQSAAPGVATVDGTGRVTAVAVGTAEIRATVEGKSGSVVVTVAAPPPGCDQAGAVRSLGVGEAVTLGGISASVICLDGGATGKEYVVVPFNAASTGSLTYRLDTQGTIPVSPASPDVAADPAARPAGPVRDVRAETAFRRRAAAELDGLVDEARAVRAAGRADGMRPSFALNTRNASVGDQVQINTSLSSCAQADVRTGRVVAVTERAIVVADRDNPAGGLTDAEYRAFGVTFDTLVYPVTVANFGEPGDLDDNGRAVIFFTKAVNELTPPGSGGGYYGGFFHPRDLFPTRSREGLDACPSSNYAEMFYMLVADPSGTVNSNPRSRELILTTTVATLAHEFQHLINASRRLYELDTQDWSEEVWLNEGMSHIAEELVFYRAAGMAPKQNVSGATLAGSARVAQAFDLYASQNFGRLDTYLRDPELQSPYDVDDDLATRGATWAFLRYAADRKGGNEAALWKSLVDATALGHANLQAALGVDPRPWIRDWTTSMFVDGAVAGLAPRHVQASWDFRTIFGGYPLRTRRLAAGQTAVVVGLSAGSGGFVRLGVPAAGAATLNATVGNQPPPSELMVTVVRTK